MREVEQANLAKRSGVLYPCKIAGFLRVELFLLQEIPNVNLSLLQTRASQQKPLRSVPPLRSSIVCSSLPFIFTLRKFIYKTLVYSNLMPLVKRISV